MANLSMLESKSEDCIQIRQVWAHRMIFIYTILVAACVASSVCRAGDDPTPTDDSGAKLLAEVRLRSDSLVPIVPVDCLQETRNFLFKTGLKFPVFNAPLSGKLGKPLSIVTVDKPNGPVKHRVFRTPEMNVGGMILMRNIALCADMEITSGYLGSDFGGVLGMNSVIDRVVELDLMEGTLRFYDRLPDRVKRSSQRFPLFGSTRTQLTIQGTLPDGSVEDFIIDTGDDESLQLRSDVFERLSRSGDIRHRRRVSIGSVYRKRVTVELGRLRQFKLGTFEHEHLRVSPSPHSHSYIGAAYLQRYVAVFDFPGKAVYLRPSERFNMPEEPADMSGLILFRTDEGTIVHFCCENSPAAKAGLQKDDRILRVNDKPAKDYSLLKLRRLLKDEGEDVRMTIQRGDKTFDVKFHLREFRTFLPELAEQAPAKK